MKSVITTLHDIGAIKFGDFKLKSGILSPIYLDLRTIISYPRILREISHLLWEKMFFLQFDLICGVPYTALPIASVISATNDIPMIMKRKEIKDYGTKKIIEGNFSKGQICLIIEDVITSGTSILETVEPIEKEGMKVNDALVIINRNQGGEKNLKDKGIKLNYLFDMSFILNELHKEEKIGLTQMNLVNEFFASMDT